MIHVEHEIVTADVPEFFAPASSDAVDMLIGQYRKARSSIEAVESFMAGQEMREAAAYFFEGNRDKFSRYIPDVDKLFSSEAAVPALNSRFWSRALSLTDVRDYMPDKRRQEWDKSIQELKTPDFEEETVRATLGGLLAQRMDFLAEMVDGIFQGLSGEHVTNRPEGFGKRMIVDWVFDSYGYSHGRKAGLIHDLRTVITKFMGRDQPYYSATQDALSHCRKNVGEWHIWDGGALNVRVYLKGTAHIEVHPDLAWRLNQVLAHRYQMAIPSQHRQRPKARKTKAVALMQHPIPFAVLSVLSSAKFHKKGEISRRGQYGEPNTHYDAHTLHMGYGWYNADKHLKREVERIIAAIGGTPANMGFAFDYDASDVIGGVLASGAIPDQKSHQFYPTPEKLARIAVELAEICPTHRCLEPSAGQGGLSEFMPSDRTVCVEVSELNCRVLSAKGMQPLQGDFLALAKDMRKFDRIIMNPPFSEGRAIAHLETASGLLEDGGRLVAILPSSYRGKDVLPGFDLKWSEVYENEFVGTSVGVVILIAERSA